VLDSGTSENNFFCSVQIEDEFVKDSPVSDVIKFDINTTISISSGTNSVVSSAYLKIILLAEIADSSLFLTIYNVGPIVLNNTESNISNSRKNIIYFTLLGATR